MRGRSPATLHQRRATLTYYSRSSKRTKSYLVHPYRLAYAQGGLYLLAHVPEYNQVRTFAVERIDEISLLEERFTPVEGVPDEAFQHSLGVHSGPPEQATIEFERVVTDYVRAREWHQSQSWAEHADGRLVLTLQVCIDQALQRLDPQLRPFRTGVDARAPCTRDRVPDRPGARPLRPEPEAAAPSAG